MISFSRWLRRRSHGEEGIAMIMVMGTIMVLTLLLGVMLSYAISVAPQAREDQDWNAALAVAQSGVDDYVARLNQNDSYWTAVDCSNVALKGPAAGTNTCGWTASTPAGWQDVKVGDPDAGRFHYDVNPSTIWTQGGIQVTSTGKVRESTRTLQVLVSRGGPTQYLYYTDFEDADPGNKVVYPGGASTACGGSGPALAKYWWQAPTRTGCTEITFVAADVLDGKVHFNDTPLVGGATTFKQGFETADPRCKNTPYASTNCVRGSGTPTLPNGYRATYAAPLYLPDNSDQFANFPGCVFTGDTRIRFNSNGTMDVWNTKSVGTTIVGPGSPSGTSCGTAANYKPAGAGLNYPASKQTIPVPNDMVIYVKNSGASAACTPGQIVNGTSSGSTSGDVLPLGTAANGATAVTDIAWFDPDSIASTVTKTFTRPNTGSGWTNPTTPAAVRNPVSDDHDATWNCGQGNLFIEGVVKGRVTVAAQNNIVVTGDLLNPSVSTPLDGSGNVKVAGGTDMLGLVAANSVVVYHPVSRGSSTSAYSVTSGSNCSSTMGAVPTSTASSQGLSKTCVWTSTETRNSTYTDLNFPARTTSSGRRYIYGSIQTLQHSFWVMSYNKGTSLGKLTVRGSIAQKWRGIVGTGSSSTGFIKDYGYDTRLKHASPPYFPQWTNAVWNSQTTGELKPLY